MAAVGRSRSGVTCMAREKRVLTAGGILLAAAVVLQVLARNVRGFGQWYSVTVYRFLTGTLGRLTGIVPFSVSELGLYVLVICCICYGIYRIRRPARLLSGTFLLVSALFFVYTVNCGINYYRQPFSASLDFKVQPSSVEELKKLCVYLTQMVNETLPEAIEDGEEAGQSHFSSARQLNRDGVAAMEKLGSVYPGLKGYYPQPKGLLISEILSYQQLSGIYSPFTIEANYNGDMTAYNIPHTICHELSHLRGYMREDEANFIGYLACVGSDSLEYRYSGYLSGWIYAGNALAKVDMDAYRELAEQLSPQARADLKANNLFWDQYEGKVAETANKMNDTYLKANSQSDGVQSYGRVVDLMLAYYWESR